MSPQWPIHYQQQPDEEREEKVPWVTHTLPDSYFTVPDSRALASCTLHGGVAVEDHDVGYVAGVFTVVSIDLSGGVNLRLGSLLQCRQ